MYFFFYGTMIAGSGVLVIFDFGWGALLWILAGARGFLVNNERWDMIWER